MNLTDQARLDLQQITGNGNDFGVDITLTAPTAETITVKGLNTKHHTGFALDGVRVNTKTASVAVAEAFLVAPYPVRNANGEVAMLNHKVDVKDSTGNLKNYIVRECFPDEELGLIVLILGDFE